jgi:hypothetical protein
VSFLSVLKDIGHVVTKDIVPLAPDLGMIPVAGPLITTVLGAVVAVEGLISKSSSGTAKKAAVTGIVNAAVPGVDSAQLSTVIDQVVASLNGLATASETAAKITPAVQIPVKG